MEGKAKPKLVIAYIVFWAGRYWAFKCTHPRWKEHLREYRSPHGLVPEDWLD